MFDEKQHEKNDQHGHGSLRDQVDDEAKQLADALVNNVVTNVAGTYSRCHICGQIEDVVEFEKINGLSRKACQRCMPSLHST